MEGHIDLSALQPLPFLFSSCVGRYGHGHLVFQPTWSIERCATGTVCLSHVLLLINGLKTF